MLSFNKKTCLAVIFVIAIGLGGCSDVPSEYKSFFSLPPGKMEEALSEYSLSQQIDIMIIGWMVPHPPFLFYFEVAKNGEQIVPLLIQRIAETNDMQTLRPMVRCMYEINKRYFEWTRIPSYAEKFNDILSAKTDLMIQKEIKGILDTGKIYPFLHDSSPENHTAS